MKKNELSLVVRKENNIDKIFRSIRILFFNKNLKYLNDIDNLFKIKRPDIKKIVIPEE